MKITITKHINTYSPEYSSSPICFESFVVRYGNNSKTVSCEDELWCLLFHELGRKIYKDILKGLPVNMPVDLDNLIEATQEDCYLKTCW